MKSHTSKFGIISMIVCVLFLCSLSARSEGFSLRFHGNGTGDIDRVKIRLDAPEKPVDIGSDFTIEFRMKTVPDPNGGVVAAQENGDGWITGNVIIDRDIYGQGDYGDYGIALGSSPELPAHYRVIAFGVDKAGSGKTIRGHLNIADGIWHHIAVTRNSVTGVIQLFVDGGLDTHAVGPSGDLSYRNGRASSWSLSDPYLVFGAEKHDVSSAYPSYNGWLDEVRISNTIRYSSAFSPPLEEYSPDAQTVGLYHFNEGEGNTVNDAATTSGSPSNGVRKYGGSPAGPEWSTDTPFGVVLPSIPVLLHPAQGEYNTNYDTVHFHWSAAANASAYQIQIATDSDFTWIVYNKEGIQDTSMFIVSFLPHTTYWWRVRASNVFGVSAFPSAYSFTTRLRTPVLCSAEGNSIAPLLTWSSVEFADRYHVQLSTDTGFAFIAYEDSLVLDTAIASGVLLPDTRYYWHVSATAGVLRSAWSSAWSFMTHEHDSTFTIRVSEKWNIISIPVELPDMETSEVLASAVSPAFTFDNAQGYVVRDTLKVGIGYWVKFPSASGVNFTGPSRVTDTVEVREGWNLIGSVSVNVLSSTVQSIPAGIIESGFYGYIGGYASVEALLPGNGYWVKVKQDGMLIIRFE